MKVIKIPINVELPCTVHEVPEPDEENCFNQIKSLIGVELGEIVVTNLRGALDRDYVLIVDEVGKCKGEWYHLINWRASEFYNGTFYGDPIVGDVVLCARQWAPSGGECDLAGLTDPELEKFLIKLI